MNIEKSCGAVVFTREHKELRYVIVRSLEGFYGFPKGHMEAGETERETALREIEEETGLKVDLLDGFRTEDSYNLMREGCPDILKIVVYFLAEFHGQTLRAQEEEISSIQLMTFDEAMNAFQFESSKGILREADEYLKSL